MQLIRRYTDKQWLEEVKRRQAKYKKQEPKAAKRIILRKKAQSLTP